MSDECIFCKIVNKETEADIVFDGGDTLFFQDISPKAPVHIVAIPKKHIVSLSTLVADDQAVIGKLMHDVVGVTEKAGIQESGYRLITNTGGDAGQEVHHLHFHILGGEPLGSLRG